MKFLIYLLIFGFSNLAQAEIVGSCTASILKGPVKIGELADVPTLDSSYEYRFLGEGKNGKVYRGTHKHSGETIVVKKYSERYRFERDLDAFSHVDRVDLPNGRVVDVYDYDSEKMLIYLEDVPGYSLEELRANPSLTSPEILENANAQYMLFREEARALLKTKGAHIENSANGYLLAGIYDPSKKKWTEFKLWYDQVILDARTLKLVWVDPF